MNRSLTRRALRAYDATAGHRRSAEIHAAAVFPLQAIHPLPEHWRPGPGFRPFAYGRWLRTIGPQLCRRHQRARPGGGGVHGPVAERDSFQQPSDSAARNDDMG